MDDHENPYRDALMQGAKNANALRPALSPLFECIAVGVCMKGPAEAQAAQVASRRAIERDAQDKVTRQQSLISIQEIGKTTILSVASESGSLAIALSASPWGFA